MVTILGYGKYLEDFVISVLSFFNERNRLTGVQLQKNVWTKNGVDKMTLGIIMRH